MTDQTIHDDYEKSIIENYTQKKKEYEESEDIMNEHFSVIVLSMLENSHTKEDLDKIKERLRVMPLCSSKALLFRKILIKEERIS